MIWIQFFHKYVHLFDELDPKTIIPKLHFDHSQLFETDKKHN